MSTRGAILEGRDSRHHYKTVKDIHNQQLTVSNLPVTSYQIFFVTERANKKSKINKKHNFNQNIAYLANFEQSEIIYAI